ncbi:hypothetical protein D3C86_1495540 [compost metagenome]
MPQRLIGLPQRNESLGDEFCGLCKERVVSESQPLGQQQQATDIDRGSFARGGLQRIVDVRQQHVRLGLQHDRSVDPRLITRPDCLGSLADIPKEPVIDPVQHTIVPTRGVRTERGEPAVNPLTGRRGLVYDELRE